MINLTIVEALTAKWDLEAASKVCELNYPLAKHDVRYFLWTMYNVVLMDRAMYDYCLNKIKFYKYDTKKLRKHTNFAKEFHTAVINEKQR